jgi:hypothetical protein
MATVKVSLTTVANRTSGATIAAPMARARVAALVESSAGSEIVPGLVAQRDEMWMLTVTGGAVRAHFDPEPEAGDTTGFMMLDGESRPFMAEAGQRCALKDVA